MGAQATIARLGLLATLYFAQGLPYGFFVQALPAIMREHGYSLSKIGLVALLALPWALKFLWAPVVDTKWWPRLGRRRTWILAMQLAGVCTLALLASLPSSIPFLMIAMFVLNTIAATQDVATDGMAVELLPQRERGFANGLQVAGYRVGMVVGGGALLGLYDDIGHRGTFAAMAVLTALASVPVLLAREPPPVPRAKAQPSVHFLKLPGIWRVMVLVLIYKFGEASAQGLIRPFLVDLKYTLDDIAWLLGTIGFVSGMAGALTGGALIGRLGRQRALVTFAITQALSVAGYAFLAFVQPGITEIAVLAGLEHFTSGMATAALFTCMMDWTRPTSSGTDYTVQASAVVIATGTASLLGGVSADAFGYGTHFLVAFAFCLVAAAVAAFRFPTNASS